MTSEFHLRSIYNSMGFFHLGRKEINLDLIALFSLEEVAHLGQHPALGVHHHIGGMGLEELGREPEPGLAGAGGADDAGVEVPGVGRVS